MIRLDYRAYRRMVKHSHSIISKLPENVSFLSKGFSWAGGGDTNLIRVIHSARGEMLRREMAGEVHVVLGVELLVRGSQPHDLSPGRR